MCLDDLHWIDPATLNILQSVLADHQLKNLLFVGSFRDNEVTEELLQWMDGMENIKRITIGDLGTEDVQELLVDLLRVDCVNDLTQLVHFQTNGNIFHVLHLIDYMQSEGLLEYSITKLCWIWDIDRLREETSLSDNVVDIVSSRLKRLKFATTSLVSQAMQLSQFNRNRIKYTHDRIHQAALRLLSSDEELERVHLYMGKILWAECVLDDASVLKNLDSRMLFVDIDTCLEKAVEEGILERLNRNRIKYTQPRPDTPGGAAIALQ